MEKPRYVGTDKFATGFTIFKRSVVAGILLLISRRLITAADGNYYFFIPRPGLILAAIMILSALYLLLPILFLNINTFYTDRMKITSLSGRMIDVIYFTDIQSWHEVYKVGPKQKREEYFLTINARNKSYRIKSGLFDYEYFIKALADAVPHARLEEKYVRNNVAAYIAGGLGCFFLLIAADSYFSTYQDITPSMLTTLHGTLEGAQVKNLSHGHYYISIDLIEYPALTFSISEAVSNFNKHDFMTQVQRADTVAMDVPNDEYRTHITHEQQPSYWERVWGSNERLEVYGIRAKGRSYLDIDAYNIEECKRFASRPLISLLFAAVSFLFSLFAYIRTRRGFIFYFSGLFHKE